MHGSPSGMSSYLWYVTCNKHTPPKPPRLFPRHPPQLGRVCGARPHRHPRQNVRIFQQIDAFLRHFVPFVAVARQGEGQAQLLVPAVPRALRWR